MSVTPAATIKITPMLRQYMEIKARHPDTLLFYRMGDFYEMFFEDAETASRALGLTLTSRSNKSELEKIPMCGVPHHAAGSYLARLVKQGFRVAVCEQMEDPALVKSGQIVRREVVRVISPGLALEELLLDDRSNLFVAAVALPGSPGRSAAGLAVIDLSTGEFQLSQAEGTEELLEQLARFAPAELIQEDGASAAAAFGQEACARLPGLCLTLRPGIDFDPGAARELVLEHFGVLSLAGFGCEGLPQGVAAAGALLAYIRTTQKGSLSHIERIAPLSLHDTLIVDEASRRNLELVETSNGGRREGSLLHVLDHCRTHMGARLLQKTLLFPLRDPAAINRRLDAVEFFLQNRDLRSALQDLLSKVHDLERLNAKTVVGSACGRDLLALGRSLAPLPQIAQSILSCPDESLRGIAAGIDVLEDLRELLLGAIREDAPVSLRDGDILREGYDAELDELITLKRDGRRLILDLEARERAASGIANLKVGFNRVFGYFIEISRGQLAAVPPHFIRRQTLAGGERFVTPELKELEDKILGAQERRLALEYDLFCGLRARCAAESSRIRASAALLAQLDLLASLAELAQRRRYVRPVVDDGRGIDIRDGRHPVIEQAMAAGRFVPNDIRLDQEKSELLIITGPNMAGKSTVLRQTALIVLMAQMGSFVPASSAAIGVVDRIFTRVGASDNLARNQSTFMVEMNETANILNNATIASLVILDEIGRGTSTFDGLAIAWAVAEELADKNGVGVKTLFATHYHELTELAAVHPRVENHHIAVREWNDSIIFLHRLMEGGVNRSYGIQVAALAGIPRRVVERAREILTAIEQKEFDRSGQPTRVPSRRETNRKRQMSLFFSGDERIRERLAAVNPDELSPRQALDFIFELKKMLDEKQ